jgi:exodeoxyribonuclease VII large subunit
VRDVFKQSNLSLLRQKQAHSSLAYNLRSVSRSLCNNRKQEIIQLAFMIRKDLATFLKQKENQVTNMVKTVANLHPQNVLKRGYTITRVNGKAITRLEEVKAADTLETIVTDGSVFSDVHTIKKSSES